MLGSADAFHDIRASDEETARKTEGKPARGEKIESREERGVRRRDERGRWQKGERKSLVHAFV